MLEKIKVGIVFGTRPEVIKLASLIKELIENDSFECVVISTGQHSSLLIQMIETFDIKLDYDLQVMTHNQSLSDLSSNIIRSIDPIIKDERFDYLVVQGDTATAFCASLVAFYHKVKVCHVEAGMRSFDRYNPFPEEVNRRLIGQLTNIHFVPTCVEFNNLDREGLKNNLYEVGNTVVDAIEFMKNKWINQVPALDEEIRCGIEQNRKILLLTTHRRENFEYGLDEICKAIVIIAERFPEVLIIFPVHPNPNVKDIVEKCMSNITNILLIDPMNYEDFLYLVSKCHIILTDSGGIQEEAPSFGKPVIVLRRTTERTLGIEKGFAMLSMCDCNSIVLHTSKLIEDEQIYNSMVAEVNPYGDGKAAEKIAKILLENEQ